MLSRGDLPKGAAADEAARHELIRRAATVEYNEGGCIIHMVDSQVDAYGLKAAGVVPEDPGLALAAGGARCRLACLV